MSNLGINFLNKEGQNKGFMKEYGEEICPENGEIRYVDRKVECSIHSMDVNGEGDDGNFEEVLFL